jgi:hypothetical protein
MLICYGCYSLELSYFENMGILTSAYYNHSSKRKCTPKYFTFTFFLHQDYKKSFVKNHKVLAVRTTLTNTQFGAVKIPVVPTSENKYKLQIT